ncbi:MAG: adenylosuccinate lyase [Gammaproteobacteria bacterium]|nr:MAG: adenylosuccinate lyase [Gammaproteobacteria bacterium]
MDEQQALTAISPLDGRYATRTDAYRELFSEQGLIRRRVLVEVRWLQFLAKRAEITGFPSVSPVVHDWLDRLASSFGYQEASRVKALEKTTNHDVKAVEYFIAEQLAEGSELSRLRPFVHFGCTSEDINNVAYALVLRSAREEHVTPALRGVLTRLRSLVRSTASLPMMSRTHGQAASPTTLGKEVANVAWRLDRQLATLESVPVMAKFNGAVGNFNAHTIACPDVDWLALSRDFLTSLGLECNPFTTQIEPHDWMAEYFDAMARINTVLLDAAQDFWSYISVGYFRQRKRAAEVGSSTMPHKVNPIDFENAEGNLGVANALLRHFSAKLPVSRLQRDLSDSTVLRNVGVAVSHSLVAYQSMVAGIEKLDPDPAQMLADLDNNWEILGEAVQMVLRRHGSSDAYEQLKALTRGRRLAAEDLRTFISGLDLPRAAKDSLLKLSPGTYTGLAAHLAGTLEQHLRRP